MRLLCLARRCLAGLLYLLGMMFLAFGLEGDPTDLLFALGFLAACLTLTLSKDPLS